jgi:L-iditol 2-dehydrogenase
VIGLTKLAAGEGHVALADRPEREPGPGEVVIDVAVVGVCGTDLHIWLGEYACAPPMTMGHEICGTVAQLGAGVDEAWLGARVAVETFFSTCGECRYCRAGRLSVCEQRRSIGTHVDGGFAPRLVLPARNLHRVPDALPDAGAALSEPLACVCNSLLDPSAVRPGDDVLVIGPGAIGLIAAQVARACGGRVTVRGTERDGARLALARELGFAVSVAGREEAPAADVVVECSGSGPGIADSLGAARRRGRLVQIGLRGADVTVPFDLICFHELTVTSGFASNPGSWRRAMGLLEAGAVELASLVTEVVRLADWERAFTASRAGDGVKYVLDPRGDSPPS